jgi:omega-hydroxy-beta-dihydromenaquinone-9 sulfotransferase
LDDTPLFMVGAGRSGSTLLARLVSKHPHVSYLTREMARTPHRPHRNRRLLRVVDTPILGSLLRRRCEIAEAYPFWERLARGFSSPMRDLRADDVTPFVRRTLHAAFAEAVLPSRPRFFAKLTGWSRIGYLNELFPNARFVHLVRDGRDVASSLLRVWFWKGWRGPENWHFGPLPSPDHELWLEYDRSFVVLAGLGWKLLVNSVEEARPALPADRFLQSRYEDFLAAPEPELRRITEFAGLDWDDRLHRAMQKDAVRDQAGRHRKDLSERQAENLTRILEPELQVYGYL